jgi:beta-glucanase (GH16 family)
MDLSTSTLPEGEWQLAWHDEFDGDTLDERKWLYRLHRFGRRVPQWTPEAVRLNGKGQLELTAFERDGQFYCGAIQTGSNFMDRPGEPMCFNKDMIWPIGKLATPTFEHTYGYWEIRCKLPRVPGWWGAFWIQSAVIGSSLDYARTGVEIDVLENFERNGKVSHNIHWGGYGADHQSRGSGDIQVENWQDEYHNYGVLWTPEALTFTIDGVQTWTVSDAVPQCPQFPLVTTEIRGAAGGMNTNREIQADQLPDVFVVDHVRVFDPA